ncbi:MAG: polysaccharide deacetylase [Candidatus Tectomicrobia bacterium]|uniref:Polysaccharide deacetylase n=1 Tax=Tectimicrobiota bacterium TaxID=2528274 RepID=A0A932I1V7_UNCTE|nr:polysaccharide deacetylase [Candidatus Tectomicrobia bacterium]
MQKIRWKNGARCAVCLTFDVDGESLWIARDPSLAHRPIHASMGAYGPKVGVPRILALLKKYGLPGTFYVPSWTAERWPKMTESILRADHEIGHHGHLHEKPYLLADREREEELLVKALEILERFMGRRPVGSRTPSCDPSAHTMELLKKHGLMYHSNLMDDDWPYYHPCGLIELPTKWSLDDFIFFGYSGNPPFGHGIRDAESVYSIWVEEFEGTYEEGGYINFMCHPQAIGQRHRMRMLERLVRHMLDKGDVWFASQAEVARHWAGQSKPAARPAAKPGKPRKKR